MTTKKLLRSSVSILMSVIMLIATVIPAYADTPMPLMEHCDSCIINFVIDEGIAYVLVDYVGQYDSFTQVRVAIKIQKRFLGIFWTTVDIGYEDKTWVSYSTEIEGTFYNEIPLSEDGIYRAVFDIDFYGNNGLVDEINEKIECSYQ